jgi:hypothetical protein
MPQLPTYGPVTIEQGGGHMRAVANHTIPVDRRNAFQQNSEQVMSEQNQLQAVQTMLARKQIPVPKEKQQVEFAVEAIVNAILKLTNGDINQTNAAMNLIGSGSELPQKVEAVVEVVKKQFNADILKLVRKTIALRSQQRKDFVDESLKHLYGPDGDKLTDWNVNPSMIQRL